MKRPRVIFLVQAYFQWRDYRRFGVATLLANGFGVEVWEVFRPWNSHYADSYVPPDPAKFPGLRHFTTMAEILQEVRRIQREDAVFALIPEVWATAQIFREMAARQVYFGDIRVATQSSTPRQNPLKKTLQSWRDTVYVRLPRWIRRTRSWRFLLLSGGRELEKNLGGDGGADHIWTHSLDYDQILEDQKRSPSQGGGHIVFLDEYVPYHPGYLASGTQPPTTAERYYPKLVAVFNELEKRLGFPVVIAAHPRARYDLHPELFGGRRREQGMTCPLIRDAALVVMHSSTSVNFAVAYRKPVLVVTTNDLQASIKAPGITALARQLGAPLINADESLKGEGPTLLEVDSAKYSAYMAAVVKRPGTPEMNTWEIVSDHLKKRTAA